MQKPQRLKYWSCYWKDPWREDRGGEKSLLPFTFILSSFHHQGFKKAGLSPLHSRLRQKAVFLAYGNRGVLSAKVNTFQLETLSAPKCWIIHWDKRGFRSTKQAEKHCKGSMRFGVMLLQSSGIARGGAVNLLWGHERDPSGLEPFQSEGTRSLSLRLNPPSLTTPLCSCCCSLKRAAPHGLSFMAPFCSPYLEWLRIGRVTCTPPPKTDCCCPSCYVTALLISASIGNQK